MKLSYLVNMANRIGQFFESMRDQEEACREVYEHLHKFWAPPMRQQLLQQLPQAEAAGLHPLVREAIRRHLDSGAPAQV